MEAKKELVPALKKKAQNEIWRRYRKSPAAVIGLMILVIFIFMVIFADVIVPYDKAIKQNYDALLLKPGSGHIFGTDSLGRDLFARIVHGSRTSLLIALSTSIGSLIVGGLLGAVGGYYGGKIDEIIMRITDVFMCIPPILLALAVVAALGTSTVNLIMAITVAFVPGVTRLVRSVILNITGQDFIEAAKAYGCSDVRIICQHILPNVFGTIIVSTTMNVSSMILSAAGLNFIGMGIQPPTPEWGAILSDERKYMRQAPTGMLVSGLAILLSALAFNLIGDGLRDALDPKLKD